MTAEQRPLEMRISLNALEHLGMNLYSNVPAVLSEIVANAWDADAQTVEVFVDKVAGKIIIDDDGTGMTRDEVIDRFLTVGFKRRAELGEETPAGRKPMGRKGIGKLSAFSIAQVVEVYTECDAERTAFRMDSSKIRAAIEGDSKTPYRPDELTDWPDGHGGATRIVLSHLSKNLTAMTVDGLKRRIARRFSIIGPSLRFRVVVNGSEIGPEDRGYHKSIEYIWTYGDQTDFLSLCTNLKRSSEDRTQAVHPTLEAHSLGLSGWIGTVASPGQLSDEEGDNLNRIAIFMRGKLAQEDVLDEFGQKEIYADYVIGELHCDGLDTDENADIATSSRQALKQDDLRFTALRDVIRGELRHVASRWSDWRRTDGTKIAQSVPAVSAWLNDLKGDTKRKAQRWIGRLNTIRSDGDGDKKELLKASILAFESYRRKEQLDKLSDISDEGLAALLPVFQDIDDLELSYYGQIVEMRLGVVRKLQKLLKDEVKEKVIQQYVFDHLWLIDPSWERARGTEHIETKVHDCLEADTAALNEEEQLARIDIAYRTASGSHVIIELKRSSVSTPVDRLVAQVRKYRSGVRKIVQQSDFKDWPIQIICLVGKPPPEWQAPDGPSDVAKSLETVDARLVFYDQLVDNAQRTYADYLEAHKKVDKLWDLFGSIDDFAPGDAD